MKKLFLALIFLNGCFLVAQEETLDDFLKISQDNLKKYLLSEWMGLDPVTDKEVLAICSEDIKKNPNSYLFLNPLSQLSITQATTLAQFKGKWLYLNGVQQLDEATAKALVQFQGKTLSLDGVQQLDEATAKALAQVQCNSLSLNGVQQLDEATAKALAQFKGWFSLNGVQQLDEDTAKAL
ncbi:MAG: hypothetical protein AABZ60_03870, partial [Planctomycetota bacterium]